MIHGSTVIVHKALRHNHVLESKLAAVPLLPAEPPRKDISLDIWPRGRLGNGGFGER